MFLSFQFENGIFLSFQLENGIFLSFSQKINNILALVQQCAFSIVPVAYLEPRIYPVSCSLSPPSVSAPPSPLFYWYYQQLCQTKNRKFYFSVLQNCFTVLPKCICIWFSVFYARTVLYIYTYLLVLFDLCTNHFRVYNSDLLQCILCTTCPAFFS